MDARQLSAVFEQVAQPAREQLKRDREGVTDVRISRFLAHLEQHLFDSKLGVRSAFRRLKLRDNNLSTVFRTQIGEPPSTYIGRLRFETAIRLLCVPDVAVWETSQMVGFETNNGFSRGFLTYSGLSPGSFQERAQAVIALAECAAVDRTTVEAALGDEITPAARRVLLAWLGKRVPQLLDWVPAQTTFLQTTVAQREDQLLPIDLVDTVVARELPVVKALWNEVQDLSFAKQIRILAAKADFVSPALFYWLRELSRRVARDEPKRGLEIANLALVSARLLDLGRIEDGASTFQALAWSWIGNLRGMLADFDRGAAAFATARNMIPENAQLVLGEWCYWKANLKWYQHQFNEALILCNQAVNNIDTTTSLRLHCEVRILRAIVCRCLDRPIDSIPDLREALIWLDPANFPVQCFSASYELTRCHLACGDHAQAAKYLTQARALLQRFQSRFYDALFVWLEGLVYLADDNLVQAERAFIDARLRLLQLKRPEHGAVLALDLVVVFARQARHDKAALMAAEALPVLERLRDHGRAEISAELAIIKTAAKESEVSPERLDKARQVAQRLLLATPTFVLDQAKGNHLLS